MSPYFYAIDMGCDTDIKGSDSNDPSVYFVFCGPCVLMSVRPVLQYSHLVDQQAAPFSVQFPVQFCSIRGRLHGEFHPKLSFSLLHRAEIV